MPTRLVEDLAPVAIDRAGREHVFLGIRKNRICRAGGENAGEHPSDRSSSPMDSEGIEGIVITGPVLYQGDHEEAEDAGDQADQQRGHGLNKTAGRGNGHQSGDRARDCSQGARLAVFEPFREHPANGCRRRRPEMGVHECACSQRSGRAKL